MIETARRPRPTVIRLCYIWAMATTTVRLDATEERILDDLAASHGGRSNAIRHALRLLFADVERQRALAALLEQWETDAGQLDDAAVEAAAERYGL